MNSRTASQKSVPTKPTPSVPCTEVRSLPRPGMYPAYRNIPCSRFSSQNIPDLYNFFERKRNNFLKKIMKWSSCGLIIVIVVLLSFGRPNKASDTLDQHRACLRPELLLSLLDIDRYNKSYPFVDYKSVLNPVLDFMLLRPPVVTDCVHELYCTWAQACLKEDPKEEIALLNTLAREITHVLHVDESVLKVSQLLYGDGMVANVMNPPKYFMETLVRNGSCVSQKRVLFEKHCGRMPGCSFFKHVDTFEAICALGLAQDNGFAAAAEEVCKEYTYIPNPLFN